MLKRVFAWVLLVGFVLLLLNIMTVRYFLAPSIAIYLVIAVWFLFTSKPLPSRKKKKEAEEDVEETKLDTEENK